MPKKAIIEVDMSDYELNFIKDYAEAHNKVLNKTTSLRGSECCVLTVTW